METIGTTRGPFDPEADAEDVPRANGVYVPGEPDPERAAVCPDCGFPTVWELQDTHEIGGERFSERLQVCDIDHIDGPNAICPECIADPEALDGLREEYPEVVMGAARVVRA